MRWCRKMLELEYEMTFAERIEGPLGPTTGSPPRLCWQVAEATLAGPRITASLAMPGIDWIRVDPNGIRRQAQRTQFLTDDGSLILMRYDAALIRGDEEFPSPGERPGAPVRRPVHVHDTPVRGEQRQLRLAHAVPVHRPRAARRA